jgi:hypothetical protein
MSFQTGFTTAKILKKKLKALFMLPKMFRELGMMVHAYNPSNQDLISSSRPACITQGDTTSKKKKKKKQKQNIYLLEKML